ncbi:MAG: hypothetical protein KGZ68_04620 [Dechloromonas sp.]|nr:hypothetical protein [Dechloromonas sp.]
MLQIIGFISSLLTAVALCVGAFQVSDPKAAILLTCLCIGQLIATFCILESN